MKGLFFLLVFFVFISSSAQAEYYVYPASPVFECYGGCERPCYHEIHSKAPYRHHHKGSEEMSEYAWVSYP